MKLTYKPVLRIDNLKAIYYARTGLVNAVDGLSLEIERGESVGLVGESGCGKSTVALAIMRLLPPEGKIIEGKIWFKGEELLDKSEDEMRKIRGKEISMIFQDPLSSLNPVYKIGDQVSEAVKLHSAMEWNEIRKVAVETLERVGIPEATKRYHDYPNVFSGGMRQRVMIAMGIVCNPDLLIADEPTTNLDVTTEAQVLELIRKLQEETGMSVLLITHNLGIVAQMCNKVGVMYAGDLVELTDTVSLFHNPLHPYTKGLLQSLPTADFKEDRLKPIPGFVPNLVNMLPICKFHDRCRYAKDACYKKKPKLIDVEPGHLLACFLFENGE